MIDPERFRLPALLFCGLVFFSSSLVAQNQRPAEALTPLDRYVHKEDPAYGFRVVETMKGEGYTYVHLRLASQTWRSEKEVDRVLWEHDLTVLIPDKVTSSTGFLMIGGGSHRPGEKPRQDKRVLSIAAATGTVVANLGQVPSQPLVFSDDRVRRVEDSAIAYTWDKFLKTGEAEWILQLPMTKSAVRAMDAITEFAGSEKGGKNKVDQFVVAGGSKRGWTTWLTAATDKRVVGIAPIVIDMLNVVPSFKHHYKAYGFFAPAVQDYTNMKIMQWMDSKEYRALLDIVEPYEYRQRLTLPKLLLNSAGDQFFLPDSSQFYVDDLQGETHLRYVPNSDHSLGGTDAVESLLAFYGSILKGKKRPEYRWKITEGGSIEVETKEAPAKVKVWQASNPKARDFRLETIGNSWKSEDLPLAEDGKYSVTVPAPEKGWTAFFVELTYPGLPKLKVTSGIKVIPNVYPHKDFKPTSQPRGFLSK
ncbi:MAG: PhoPQ-activated pathogenicity-related family protein [Verrucomicrobiota bacterium]